MKNKSFHFCWVTCEEGLWKVEGMGRGVDFKYRTSQYCTIFIKIQFVPRAPIMHHLTQDSWDTKSSQDAENNVLAQWLGNAAHHMLG